MKRIRIGAAMPALLVLSPLSGGVFLLHGCVPDPDISDLPPYDAGVTPGDSSIGVVDSATPDTGSDAVATDASDAAPPSEASVTTATLQGVVIDFAQGGGLGVVPGATIAVVNTNLTTTAAADGTFVLTGVPAQKGVQVEISHPSAASGGIVYSTTQVVLDLAAGQTVTIEPVLHEGCAADVSMTAANPVLTASLSNATCGNGVSGSQYTASYVSVAFQDSSSLVDPTTGATYTGSARVEMIPLAFPTNAASKLDYTWGAGLPGRASQVDTIGAVEVRVFADPGGTVQQGTPLAIANGKKVTLTFPVPTTTTSLTGYAPWYYDATTGAWTADTTGATLGTLAIQGNVKTASIVAPHLTWWAATNPLTAPDGGTVPATGCFSGTLTNGGSPAAGVWVHAVGTDWLGAASAVTDANGSFCVDTKPSSHVTLQAASVNAAARTVSQLASAVTQSSGIGGSCELGQGCVALGTLAMSTIAAGCVSGTVNPDGGTWGTPPSTYNLEILGLNVGTSENNAGVLDTAYVGTVTTSGANNAFCAPVPEGQQFALVDPGNAGPSGCELNSTNGQFFTAVPFPFVADTTGPGTCGGTGCTDAGDVFYGCY